MLENPCDLSTRHLSDARGTASRLYFLTLVLLNVALLDVVQSNGPYGWRRDGLSLGAQ
jgi:hypothetical protein